MNSLKNLLLKNLNSQIEYINQTIPKSNNYYDNQLVELLSKIENQIKPEDAVLNLNPNIPPLVGAYFKIANQKDIKYSDSFNSKLKHCITLFLDWQKFPARNISKYGYGNKWIGQRFLFLRKMSLNENQYCKLTPRMPFLKFTNWNELFIYNVYNGANMHEFMRIYQEFRKLIPLDGLPLHYQDCMHAIEKDLPYNILTPEKNGQLKLVF